jgi:hypothetical protein
MKKLKRKQPSIDWRRLEPPEKEKKRGINRNGTQHTK